MVFPALKNITVRDGYRRFFSPAEAVGADITVGTGFPGIGGCHFQREVHLFIPALIGNMGSGLVSAGELLAAIDGGKIVVLGLHGPNGKRSSLKVAFV